MKRVVRMLLLAGLLAGCSHLKPQADTHPPAYQEPGRRGFLDVLAEIFWPGESH